jgi:hypothetical protein
MLSKVCATWLMVLVVLPFTAPFSTIDMSDVVPGQSDRAGTLPSKVPAAALTHAVLPRAVPFPTRASRLRLALDRLRTRGVVVGAPLRAPALSGALLTFIDHPLSKPTILRI